MRFHLPGLPGQPVTKDNSVCAFTQKVRKFAEMMIPRGHEVFIYGDPKHEVNCTEYIECYPAYGAPPPFTSKGWELANREARKEIVARVEKGDFLGLMGGNCQAELANLLPDLISVEYGIGYGGSFAPYRVFESYAWMHTTYGQQRGTNEADGSFYDAVIPAYFEVDDFPFEKNRKDDYLLYVGRLTWRKGVKIAEETAERVGLPLKIAGEGDYEPQYGETLGNLTPGPRNELMAGARALLCPTIYVEPFGCIAVEAQLCGTPAIATDWGAFTETVRHGEGGYRCRTLQEFCWAAENVDKLNRKKIRKKARQDYSLETIGIQYEAYFEQLSDLHEGLGWNGFYEGLSKGRHYGRASS